MPRFCDLHTHSCFSDGSFTPAELIAMAKEAELSALALCDHNAADGLPDFLAAAEGGGIQGQLVGVGERNDIPVGELKGGILLGATVGPEAQYHGRRTQRTGAGDNHS